MDELRDRALLEPLLWRRKDRPEVNRQRGFAETVAALNVDELVAEYQHDRRVAPRRSELGKRYFVEGHDAVPASGEYTNRVEEHLALALFGHCNVGGRLARPLGDCVRFVGYQVPLKARQSDSIGKIDLVGLLDDGRVCVVELKSPTAFGDSPLRALIEGLSYAAVLESNRASFDEELLALHPDAASGSPLVVVVLGSISWWQAWQNSQAAGAWTQPFNALCHTLQERLDLTIACAALDGFDTSELTLGLNRQAPTLRSIPTLVDVAGLPALPRGGSPIPEANSYLGSVVATMHAYASSTFEASVFDGHTERTRPPVFGPEHAHHNVIAAPDDALTQQIVSALPSSARHRHFASMRSSQALTQTVFGALAAAGHLEVLESVVADCGRPAFARDLRAHTMTFEKRVTWLAEPRSTSVDVWIETPLRRIAVECKLTESAFGRCSRPTLERNDPSFCDGSYRHQLEREHRCSLSELGIAYWQHIPLLLQWSADRDHIPCPLDATYQIVRNVLAAVIKADGSVETDTGHAVIVYDARNPAFDAGGAARNALDTVYDSLRYPEVLRTASWQSLIRWIAEEPACRWLTDALNLKYGLAAEPANSRAKEADAVAVRPRSPSPPAPRSAGRLPSLSFVYGQAIDPRGYVLLTVRGNSYRLRNPRRGDWASGYLHNGIPTVDALLNSGIIEDIQPVTQRAGRVDSDTGKNEWARLLAQIDAQHGLPPRLPR